MIYTITFNPSIDYHVTVDELNIGGLNRTSAESVMPGGKGINVSIMLKNLGLDSIALGFTGGYTGTEIKRLLALRGIDSDFTEIEGSASRINVKLKSPGTVYNEINNYAPDQHAADPGRHINVTEINGSGPVIGRRELTALYHKLDKLKDGDMLILSGSTPAGMSDSAYADIMEYISDRGIDIVVDASGDLLGRTLASHPFLIKPNRKELEGLFNVTIASSDYDSIIKYSEKLQVAGAENVLISMDKDGAILLTGSGRRLLQPAPEGRAVNSVGSGDSMIAGFITEYIRSGDYKRSLRYSVAAGSASAFSEDFADKAFADKLMEELPKTISI